MQLYAGTSKQFVDDAIQNQIAGKLEEAFQHHYSRKPGKGEVRSWQNSLTRMCSVIQYGELYNQGVVLECQLPLSSKRLDFLITGKDQGNAARAVIVELKQWDKIEPSYISDCVVTYVGKGNRDVLHPSRQVLNYQQYLEDFHTAFSSGEVALNSCSYLHNLMGADAGELFDNKFAPILSAAPLFVGDSTQELVGFLSEHVGGGEGDEVLKVVEQSRYRASRKLLDHAKQMIQGQPTYVLLDEQQVVFNAVLSQTRKGYHNRGKVVILVKGGPGTGKSVVALNLVAELSGSGLNTQHATGSRAFTENVRKIVGSRAGVQFKYFNSFAGAARDVVDVLVLDEAHRIRETSANRYTPAAQKTGLPQIEEILNAARVSVFFIDDLQVVRPGEIGSSQLIIDAANRIGAEVKEFELEAQFRCSGSDGYINWIDTMLGIRQTGNEFWDPNDSAYHFEVCDSAEDLEAAIREKAQEGANARLAAGFCWPWSDPNPDGTLVHDVKIGEWSMPWNAKPDSTRLGAGIPKSHYWASDPGGINQVGCVYTAQGFEYDYAGVIFGKDIRFDPQTGEWVGNPAVSHDSVVRRDRARFTELVKQTYRVLLTRGIRGTFVYFMDDETRDYFLSRTQLLE